jgi:hypothetical protein
MAGAVGKDMHDRSRATDPTVEKKFMPRMRDK